MKLYTTQNKKLHFTYQSDWTGYNIPSKVLLEARSTFGSPVSQYDYTMNEIIEYCERESRIQNRGEQHSWYLIGVDKLKSGVMNHEIAHGFYFTNPHYKVEMDYLIGDINTKDYEHLKKILVKGGYSDDKCIIDDEIQAYMSTGKHTEWNDSVYQKYSQDFIKIFTFITNNQSILKHNIKNTIRQYSKTYGFQKPQKFYLKTCHNRKNRRNTKNNRKIIIFLKKMFVWLMMVFVPRPQKSVHNILVCSPRSTFHQKERNNEQKNMNKHCNYEL
jgi:hypothetical protein